MMVKGKSNYWLKGKPSWNKGKHFSEESKEKMRLAKIGTTGFWRGKHRHIETIEKIKKTLTGRIGNPISEEQKNILRISKIGKGNPNWLGGISFEPYGIEFNNTLREQIRKRDNYRCQECFRHQDELRTKTNKSYKLPIHHIDFNKKNNKQENLISLCMSCHAQTHFNREHWINYYKEKVRGFNTYSILDNRGL